MKLFKATKRLIACILMACMIVMCIPASDANAASAPAPDWSKHRAVYTIVIDPGHGQKGGSDCGAIGNGLYERDVNLKIALYLRDELSKYDNVRVYMTRTTQASPFYTMQGIGTYAASVNADALISIHNNSSTNSNSTGSLVCVPNENYDANCYTVGNGLARSILNNLASLGLKNNGLLPRLTENGSKYPDGSLSDYYSIVRQGKENHVPAIIVEHAFISNSNDCAKWLSNDAGLKKLAQADAKGIADYFNFDRSKGLEPTISKNIDYSTVYDYNYYVNKYPDLKETYGSDKIGVFFHFLDHGMKEGRQAKVDFNYAIYKENYKDLQQAYGNKTELYYEHYIRSGAREGRNASTSSSWTKNTTKYNGLDYSAVYNYDYYVSKYPSLKTTYGTDYKGLFMYFINTGMKQGQQASANFDVKSYAYLYEDLRRAYGNDLKNYYIHYIRSGKKEGRKATGVTKMQKPITVLNGRDYSAVYDYYYYINRYSDIEKTFGVDDLAILKHFVNSGMKEGRRGNANFDYYSYSLEYKDLRRAFGTNKSLYYLHYIEFGKKEGRKATGTTAIKDYETVYNGVDYKDVYDFNYYINKYSDLRVALGNDDLAVLKHFVNSGMREGRQAKADFDVKVYRLNYADLSKAFGKDRPLYYLHYIKRGKAEGRIATGTPNMNGATTVYKGVDYSAVYDFNYYINKYPDLKKAFGAYNEDAAIEHFATYGLEENRQAKTSYDKSVYEKLRNDAIRATMDAEGKTSIMGTTTITKAQMVAFYKATATYPDYYKNTDAPTIEAFCQIYLEECAAEGVRAEVAFAQAMIETGYLRYGGLVKIEDKNFAGLGATDSASERKIAQFPTVRQGVRAQIQHLKAYASTDALKNAVVDPRFNRVTRGTAIYVEYLSIPNNPYGKGWASDPDYASKIKNVMNKIKLK